MIGWMVGLLYWIKNESLHSSQLLSHVGYARVMKDASPPIAELQSNLRFRVNELKRARSVAHTVIRYIY